MEPQPPEPFRILSALVKAWFIICPVALLGLGVVIGAHYWVSTDLKPQVAEEWIRQELRDWPWRFRGQFSVQYPDNTVSSVREAYRELERLGVIKCDGFCVPGPNGSDLIVDYTSYGLGFPVRGPDDKIIGTDNLRFEAGRFRMEGVQITPVTSTTADATVRLVFSPTPFYSRYRSLLEQIDDGFVPLQQASLRHLQWEQTRKAHFIQRYELFGQPLFDFRRSNWYLDYIDDEARPGR